MMDIVIGDYNDLVASCNFDMLKDVIEHRFMGDLEDYIPEKTVSFILFVLALFYLYLLFFSFLSINIHYNT